MGYKISYLWLYVINFLTTALLFAIKAMDIDVPKIIHWGENVIYCMGIWMLLSLWGKAFEANEENNKRPILNRHITQLLTFSLLIIEGMGILYITFNKTGFMLPGMVSLCIWIISFSYLSLVSKNLFKTKISAN